MLGVLQVLRQRLGKQRSDMEDALAMARQLDIGPGQFLDAVLLLERECGALDDAIDICRARPTPEGKEPTK